MCIYGPHKTVNGLVVEYSERTFLFFKTGRLKDRRKTLWMFKVSEVYLTKASSSEHSKFGYSSIV